MRPGSERDQPIFMVGVPRSGTTLLRMMIDSHPRILCGPEAPWIAGRGHGSDLSLRRLAEFLCVDHFGPVGSFPSVDEDAVHRAAAAFLDGIMGTAARASGKQRWADKTPESILALPFLHRLFPAASFVLLVRDGRDVALSTTAVGWAELVMGPGERAPNDFDNALRRWRCWNEGFVADARRLGVPYHVLRYEELVERPRATMQALLGHLGEEWDDSVLAPYAQAHSAIDGEGPRSFYRRARLSAASSRRWRRELSESRRAASLAIAGKTLAHFGYETEG